MGDPYVSLAQAVRAFSRSDQPAGMCLGVVKSVGAGHIEIQTDSGLVLDKADILINAQLKDSSEEQTHTILSSTNIQMTGTFTSIMETKRLNAGDRVLLQPINDGQTYVILCKVVTV